jgi:hypothetical protein
LLKDDGKLRREKVYAVRSKKSRKDVEVDGVDVERSLHEVVCATHEVGFGSDIEYDINKIPESRTVFVFFSGSLFFCLFFLCIRIHR